MGPALTVTTTSTAWVVLDFLDMYIDAQGYVDVGCWREFRGTTTYGSGGLELNEGWRFSLASIMGRRRSIR